MICLACGREFQSVYLRFCSGRCYEWYLTRCESALQETARAISESGAGLTEEVEGPREGEKLYIFHLFREEDAFAVQERLARFAPVIKTVTVTGRGAAVFATTGIAWRNALFALEVDLAQEARRRLQV